MPKNNFIRKGHIMIRLLIVMLLVFSFAKANGQRYFIKFGSFKNIVGLKKNIRKLPNSLRSHVIIVRKNGWYIPFAYYTSNKRVLYSKVSSYKRYFPDAHIAKSSSMLKYPIVQNYSKIKHIYKPYTPPVHKSIVPKPYTVAPQIVPQYQNVAISPEDHILPPIPRVQQSQNVVPVVSTTTIVPAVVHSDDFEKVEIKQYKQFNKQMLSGHHYYLAYKGDENNPDLLIKVSFKNDEVIYQPVIGDMKMTKASYLVDGDRLYMFTNAFTRDGAFSKIEENKDDHIIVSSWINGKKLNILRYYYKLNDAKAYLGLETSNGLSEALQEGEFFWDKYR